MFAPYGMRFRANIKRRIVGHLYHIIWKSRGNVCDLDEEITAAVYLIADYVGNRFLR